MSNKGFSLTEAERMAEAAPAPTVGVKPVDPNSPKCVGCGRYHGSVNVELKCMRDEIVRLRAR